MNGKRKEVLKTCIVIELCAVVLLAVLSMVVYHFTRKSVQSRNEEKVQQFMLRGDIPKYSFSAEIRQTDVEFGLDSVDSLWLELQQDKTYEGGFAFACYYRNRTADAGMVLDGDIAVAVVDSETERRTWNLWEYFPKRDLEEFVGKVFESRKEKKVWASPMIRKIRGRDAEDGTEMLTQIEIYVPSLFRNYTITAKDFAGTDRVLWDDGESRSEWPESGEDAETGSEARLYLISQDARLSTLLRELGAETLDSKSRYTAITQTIGAEEGGSEDIILSARQSKRGEITVAKSGEVDASSALMIVFDNAKIARNALFRPMVVVLLLGQTFAIIAMILLVAARRRREDLKNLRDMFINAMAHELKTPAAVIKNTAEYLSLGAKPEKMPHYLDVLERESEALSEKLNRMLTYTRVTDERLNLNLVSSDWNLMTDAVIASYADMIAEKGMEVDFSLRRSENVSCDPALMGMVIDNFVGNAVRHGAPGSRIIIETEGKRFRIWNQAEALSEEELKEIWTPMYQTKRKSEDSRTGGMGLAICAGILKRHGAMCGAGNRDGGLLFWFDFSKSKDVEKARRLAWIHLLTATFGVMAAFAWGMSYVTGGKTLWLLLSTIWLLYGILFTFNYTQAKEGKHRVSKKDWQDDFRVNR
ncbi:MAG: HAMP domain-containing histidine kinase [Lachnospiraceae bacterium]|nr:HAMP domain-containing histidine kinase [Lachnospiraceae bacterium]